MDGLGSADAPSSDDEGSSRSFSSSSSKTTNSKNSPQSHLLRRDPSSGSDPSASDDALSLAVLLNSCLKPAPLQLHNADAADRSNCSSTTGGHSPTAPRPAHRKRKSPSPQPRGVQQTWTLLLFLLFCMIISSASFSLLAPILPEEAPARGVSGLRLGSIFSADQLVCVIFCPLFGALLQAGRLRSMSLLLSGMALNGLGNIVFGLVVPAAPSPAAFVSSAVVLRAVCGLGAAAINTAAISLAIAAAGAESSLAASVGTAIGMLESSETLGEALGPVIGSFLYVNSGFGRTFIFFGLLNAILGPITWWILFCPCDPAPDASLITHPDVESGRHVEFEPEEEEVPIWTSVRRVLSNPAATVLLLASCTGSASFTFLDATLAGHLNESWGLQPTAIGWAFGLLTVAYTLSCPLHGYIAARIGPAHSLASGLLCLFVGFCVLGPAPLLAPLLAPLAREGAYAGLGTALASLTLLGFGLSLSFVPALPALIHAVEHDATAARARAEGRMPESPGLEDLLAGLLNSLYFLGGAIGAPCGAAVAEAVGVQRAYQGLAMFLAAAAVVLELVTWTYAARGHGAHGGLPEHAAPLLLNEYDEGGCAAERTMAAAASRRGPQLQPHVRPCAGAEEGPAIAPSLLRLQSTPNLARLAEDAVVEGRAEEDRGRSEVLLTPPPTALGLQGTVSMPSTGSARPYRVPASAAMVVTPPFVQSPRGRGPGLAGTVVFSHGLHALNLRDAVNASHPSQTNQNATTHHS